MTWPQSHKKSINYFMTWHATHTSQRRESIIPISPNLAVVYEVLLLVPNFPAMDKILITWPKPEESIPIACRRVVHYQNLCLQFIPGKTSWVSIQGAKRSTSMICLCVGSCISMKFDRAETPKVEGLGLELNSVLIWPLHTEPALLMRMSIPPNRAFAFSVASLVAEGSLRSTGRILNME